MSRFDWLQRRVDRETKWKSLEECDLVQNKIIDFIESNGKYLELKEIADRFKVSTSFVYTCYSIMANSPRDRD